MNLISSEIYESESAQRWSCSTMHKVLKTVSSSESGAIQCRNIEILVAKTTQFHAEFM